MNERLKVRFAYQRGWQVVDGSTILQTFQAVNTSKTEVPTAAAFSHPPA